MLLLLNQGAFLRLWLAQLVSQLGDGITDVAVIVLVAQASHSGLFIGLVIFAQMLPTAVLGAFMGPLADRWPQRHLMVAADIYRTLIVLSMIWARHSVWLLLILIALQGVGSAAFAPARSAAIPRIVGEANIVKATGLSQGTWSAMRIIGPAVGGLFLALQQTNLVFMTDAATFLFSAALIGSIRVLSTPIDSLVAGAPYVSALRDGVRQISGLPVLRFFIILLAILSVTGGMFNTDGNAVLLNDFHVPTAHFGLLDTVFGIGAILGSLCGPYILSKLRPGDMLFGATAALALSMMVVIVVNDWRETLGLTPIYVWFVLVGYLMPLLNVPVSSLFVAVTPKAFRGRASGLLQASANASQLIGILVGGWLAGVSGALTACAVTGIMLMGAAFVLPWLKGFRQLREVTKLQVVQEPVRQVPAHTGVDGTGDVQTQPDFRC